MKRILSFVLILVMVLGLLAGCGAKPGDADNAGLEAAKTYLHAMYKEEAEITAVDYSRVGVVMIDGVSYTVTWTADNESIKITPADKLVKIELPDTLEEIPYTLTATVADANGNTVTLSFARKVPAAAGLPTSIADGTYVILACGNLTMSSLAEDKGYGYPYATEVTVSGGAVSGHKIADVLTIKNVDGGVTIQDAYGRFFYLKGTYNSFNVGTEAPAEGHVWEVLKNGDNYLIVNAMNKKTLAYDSGYTSWGAYPELGETHNYLLNIVPATAPAEDPVDPTPDEPVVNNDPAADSKLSVADAIALGASKAHNTYTEGKYYVTGVITEVYNEQYGNMKITDDKGNILTVYGTFDADGTNRYDAMGTKPVAGDTITVYGIIGQYNDTPQIKNGWIVAHTPAAGGNADPEPSKDPEPSVSPDPQPSKDPEPSVSPDPEPSKDPEPSVSPDPEPSKDPEPSVSPEPSADPVATLTKHIAEANKLANKELLPYESTITGVITDAPQASSKNAGCYKFTVSDGTNSILCYFVPVTGGTPKKGDTVTVTGKLTAYNGAAQFSETDSTATWISAGEVADEPTEPSGPVTAAGKVKIYYPKDNKYASDKSADRNRLAGVSEADATVWTVEIDDKGYYSFSSNGKYMTSGATGNSMSMESTLTDCGRWEVIATNGGVLLRNVGANYNGNYNQYMEFYYDFTTYGLKEGADTTIYTFQLIEVK